MVANANGTPDTSSLAHLRTFRRFKRMSHTAVALVFDPAVGVDEAALIGFQGESMFSIA